LPPEGVSKDVGCGRGGGILAKSLSNEPMRILQITAGAASMYCGSCLRDNALAAELIREGHSVTLLPLYTPTRTDEENVSHSRVFFGGISVYLQEHSALFRHTPWIVDRLWDSQIALKLAAQRSIPVDPKLLGEMTVSVLEGENGHLRKEMEKLLDWLRHEPPPDVINLPYSLVISLAAPLKRELCRPICLTLQGEDIFIDGLIEPYRSRTLDLIRANLPHIDRFLAVSEYYAAHMSRFLGIERDRMDIVPLGINTAGYSGIREPRTGFRIGYLGRIAPEKGLHLLAEAFRLFQEQMRHSNAQLEFAGYLAPEHRAYLESIERQMGVWGLGARFSYRGELNREEKIDFLRGLDVFAAPSVYQDPKGLAVIEAMAAGTPVVLSRSGSYPEMVEKTGAGLVVERNDVVALAQAFARLSSDPDLAGELSRRGPAGVRDHYSAPVMARAALAAYRRALGEPAPALMA
jgi:glycosyltransferase involved in cell wall biosynthesis